VLSSVVVHHCFVYSCLDSSSLRISLVELHHLPAIRGEYLLRTQECQRQGIRSDDILDILRTWLNRSTTEQGPSSTGDSTPSNARKPGFGGGSLRKYAKRSIPIATVIRRPERNESGGQGGILSRSPRFLSYIYIRFGPCDDLLRRENRKLSQRAGDASYKR
jgi:hypothetical protein